MTVAEHTETINLKDMVITPAHADRTASPEFERSIRRLKEDGHYVCWVTGLKDGDRYPDGEIVKLQVHHVGCEWSLQGFVDFDKLKEFLETFDVYGYGRLMKNIPLTSVDDIRNQMVLGQRHHTGVNHAAGNATGIHDLVFPMWIIQAIAKTNDDPVPQQGETIEAAEKRLEGDK
jgi:hypothetical protein